MEANEKLRANQTRTLIQIKNRQLFYVTIIN